MKRNQLRMRMGLIDAQTTNVCAVDMRIQEIRKLVNIIFSAGGIAKVGL